MDVYGAVVADLPFIPGCMWTTVRRDSRFGTGTA